MASKKSKRDKVRQHAKNMKHGGAQFNILNYDGNYLKIVEDENIINIVPYRVTVKNHPQNIDVGDTWYQRTILVHKNIGPNNIPVICPRTFGKKCYVCEKYDIAAEDYEENKDLCYELKAQTREIFNTINDDDEIELWNISTHLFGKLLASELGRCDEEYMEFFELEDGASLKVRFKEEKKGRFKFLTAERIDFEERDDFDDDILDEVYDLDDPDLYKLLSYEELKSLFLAEDEEDEEEEDTPKKKKTKRKVKKSKKKIKEEDDEDIEDDDEEEEEEKPKKTKRKAKRSSKKKVKEEEEEEEEEKPKRKSKRKKKTKETSKKKTKKKEEEDECPGSGTFGINTNEFDECDTCEQWEDCVEEQDRLKKKKKNK
jgi:hypothetical protein